MFKLDYELRSMNYDTVFQNSVVVHTPYGDVSMTYRNHVDEDGPVFVVTFEPANTENTVMKWIPNGELWSVSVSEKQIGITEEESGERHVYINSYHDDAATLHIEGETNYGEIVIEEQNEVCE